MLTSDTNVSHINPKHYRAIFISDVHLGHSGCSAEFLLDFLRSTTCDYLYLVGDIIDVWQMKKSFYWPQAHNDVIRTILGKAKHGTRITYVPGNHDDIFRAYASMQLGNLEIQSRCIHTSKNGNRFLVMHGDEFDAVVRSSRAVALLGSSLYNVLLRLNGLVNLVRRRFGFPYWSLARALKHQVKHAVNFISNFETALAYAAEKHQVDGLVSGHIHHAEICRINDIIYCNCGDWVESCTALVETNDGNLELLHWTEQQSSLKTFKLEAVA